MFKKKLVDRAKAKIKVLKEELQKINQRLMLVEREKRALIQKGISIKGGIIELEGILEEDKK